MQIRLPGIHTRDELRNHVIATGAYSEQENTRIYEKWFAHAPRYLFRAADQKYRISERSLCDVGCSYGFNLCFCRPGSYGIELEHYEVHFAQSIGLKVFRREIVNDDLSDLPKVDTVWNSAVLEHITAPHIFLRKLHSLLKPDGLLVLYIPIIPWLPVLTTLPRIGGYFGGYEHGDHINAFTPSTIRFFCERAGFDTLEVTSFYPGVLALFNRIHLIGGCTYIGRKNANWEYPSNATRRKADNINGFTWVGQKFADTEKPAE
jgi:SAM-dependent methyltransferase